MKRFTALLLALILLCSLALPANALYWEEDPYANTGFPDVTLEKTPQPFLDAILYVTRLDHMQGVLDTTDQIVKFRPNASTSRAQVATILYRHYGQKGPFTCDFQDVTPGTWYYEAVSWANYYGIMVGTGDGQFRPHDPITREQLMTTLYRYSSWIGYPGKPTAQIGQAADHSQISGYAQEAMAWAVHYGLLLMDAPTSRLYPQARESRQWLALYLQRYLQLEDTLQKDSDDLWLQGMMSLELSASYAATITNAEGETLRWNGIDANYGDLAVFREGWTTGFEPDVSLYVEASDWYIVEVSAPKGKVGLIGIDTFMSMYGTGFQKVTLYHDNRMTIEADQFEGQLVGDVTGDYMLAWYEGSFTGSGSFTFRDNGAALTSNCTAWAVRLFRESTLSMEHDSIPDPGPHVEVTYCPDRSGNSPQGYLQIY